MSKILGYKSQYFDPEYLKLALSHRSYSKNNNERLEFLGDSVLGLVISQWLYSQFPDLPEGKLSRMRSQLVRGDTLAQIAKYYDLGDSLNLGIGELKSGGHKRESVLADTVEAIFGAVLMDKGFAECQDFILKIMANWLAKVDPNLSDKDAKTQLQEYLQKESINLAQYKLVAEFGKDHLKEFQVEVTVADLKIAAKARSRSIKKAEQECARIILNQVQKKS